MRDLKKTIKSTEILLFFDSSNSINVIINLKMKINSKKAYHRAYKISKKSISNKITILQYKIKFLNIKWYVQIRSFHIVKK